MQNTASSAPCAALICTHVRSHACAQVHTAQAVVRVASKAVVHIITVDARVSKAHAALASCTVEENAAASLQAQSYWWPHALLPTRYLQPS